MNKTELSIGDWVKVPRLVYYNSADRFDNGIYQVRRLKEFYLDVYTFDELSYSEVEPIVITKAILEKLGFVEKEAGVFKLRTDDILVIYSTACTSLDILKAKDKLAEQNTIKYEEGNTIEFDLSAKIIYVHQLQHLLRMVGKEFSGIELAGIYEWEYISGSNNEI